MDVNGRLYQNFICSDLSEILKTVNQKEVKLVNEKILEICLTVLANQPKSTTQTSHMVNNNTNKDQSDEINKSTNSPLTIDNHSIMYMSPRNILMSIENPQTTIVYPEPRNRKDSIDHNICPVCELAVTDSDSIECNACDMWLHKYCTVLSDEHFEKHTTDIDMLYTCHLCTLLDQDECATAVQDECHRSLVYFDLEMDREGVMTPSVTQPIRNDVHEDPTEIISEADSNRYTSGTSSTFEVNDVQETFLPPSSHERTNEQSENMIKYPSVTRKNTTGSKNLSSQEIPHSEK
ncbi:unnamed protein product [Mytilus edulis]|uniref:PHD-type domain-containing protein n=1 Tax=Mytilus edulis TaxID=6550 RepID=A0A8S3TM71_MYTED|nr:unnamed protein product [Mytilus edulis]